MCMEFGLLAFSREWQRMGHAVLTPISKVLSMALGPTLYLKGFGVVRSLEESGVELSAQDGTFGTKPSLNPNPEFLQAGSARVQE